jgi:hypothetical protein
MVGHYSRGSMSFWTNKDRLSVEQQESLLHEDPLFRDLVAALSNAGEAKLAKQLDDLQTHTVNAYAAGNWTVPETGETHTVPLAEGTRLPTQKDVKDIFSAAYYALPDKEMRARISKAMARMDLPVNPPPHTQGR